MSHPTKSIVNNSAICQIPGFLKPVMIPFPKSKLPVCARCKKAYRARSLCRERDGHLAPPWKSAYACIQIDDKCLSTDAQGQNFLLNENYSNIEFVAQLEDSSILYETAQTIKDSDYPMCKKCKEVKNYSREHCRCKHNHRELPWNVFHMKLTPVTEARSFDSLHGNMSSSSLISRTQGEYRATEAAELINEARTEIVYDGNHQLEVPESKAFLLVIGSGNCSLHWLDRKVSIDYPCIVTGNGPLTRNISMQHSSEQYRYPDTNILFNDDLKSHTSASINTDSGYKSELVAEFHHSYRKASDDTIYGAANPHDHISFYPTSSNALAPQSSSALKQNRDFNQISSICKHDASLLKSKEKNINNQDDTFERNLIDHNARTVSSTLAGGLTAQCVDLKYNPSGVLSNYTAGVSERYCESSLTETFIRMPHHEPPYIYYGNNRNFYANRNFPVIGSTYCPWSLCETEQIDIMSSPCYSNQDGVSSSISCTTKTFDRKRSMDGISESALISTPSIDLSPNVNRSTFASKRATPTRRVSLPAQSSFNSHGEKEDCAFGVFDNTMRNPHFSWDAFSLIDHHNRWPRRMSSPPSSTGEMQVPTMNYNDSYFMTKTNAKISYPSYSPTFFSESIPCGASSSTDPTIHGCDPCFNPKTNAKISYSSLSTPNFTESSHCGTVRKELVSRRVSLDEKKLSKVYRSDEVEENVEWNVPNPFDTAKNVSRRVSFGYPPPFRAITHTELNTMNSVDAGLYASSSAAENRYRRVSILNADHRKTNNVEEIAQQKGDDKISQSGESTHTESNRLSLDNRHCDIEDGNAFKRNKQNTVQGSHAITGNSSSPTLSHLNSLNKSAISLEPSNERRVSLCLDHTLGLDTLVEEVGLDHNKCWLRKLQDYNEDSTGPDHLLSSALRLKIPNRRLSDSSWSIPFINFDDDSDI